MNIQRRPHSMRLIRTEGFHFTWAQEERQMLVLSLSCLRTIFIKTFLRLVYSREIPFSFLVVLCYDSLFNFWLCLRRSSVFEQETYSNSHESYIDCHNSTSRWIENGGNIIIHASRIEFAVGYHLDVAHFEESHVDKQSISWTTFQTLILNVKKV